MGLKSNLALGLAIVAPFSAGAGALEYVALPSEHHRAETTHTLQAHHAGKLAVNNTQIEGISQTDKIESSIFIGLVFEGVAGGAIALLSELNDEVKEPALAAKI
jgi:hypothetical protein